MNLRRFANVAAAAAALAAAGDAAAQLAAEVRFTITNTSSQTYNVRVSNTSTTPVPIVGWRLELTPAGAEFDDFPCSPACTVDPAIGGNNTGGRANAITVTPPAPILPGQSFQSGSGDIDGSTQTAIAVTVYFDNGIAASGSAPIQGTTPATIVLAAAGGLPVRPAVLTWELPTTYVDETPLPPGEIAGFRVETGTCTADDSFGAKLAEATVDGPAVTYTTPALAAGRYCFRASTLATNGEESEPSNPVATTILAPPTRPTELRVTGEAEFVYVIAQSRDFVGLVPVGTIGPDVQCAPRPNVEASDGRVVYMVPNEAVDWPPDSDVRSETVFAECFAD